MYPRTTMLLQATLSLFQCQGHDLGRAIIGDRSSERAGDEVDWHVGLAFLDEGDDLASLASMDTRIPLTKAVRLPIHRTTVVVPLVRVALRATASHDT